jgi:hypothetical protein
MFETTIQTHIDMHLQTELSLQDKLYPANYSHLPIKAAEEIGRGIALSEKEMETVRLAAWLYDNESSYLDISQKASIIDDFLTSQHVSSQVIRQAYGCIQASRLPCKPTNLMEETLCDACSCYIADKAYFEQAKSLKKEKKKQMSKQEWLEDQINLFTNHRFFTPYAIEKFTAGKEKNLLLLREKLGKLTDSDKISEEPVKKKAKSNPESVHSREVKIGRGIETMFRTTMASHLQLSVMADNKANIMISINAIIISFLISSFANKFNESPDLILPTILLTCVCLFTIIFSLLSTRPTIRMKRNKDTIATARQTDLLFFGDFTNLSAQGYREGIRELMADNDVLYNSMTDNIYRQGKVLSRKYRLLKIAYTIFMIGFIGVVIAYICALCYRYGLFKI